MATAFEAIRDLKVRKEDVAQAELRAEKKRLEQAAREVERVKQEAEDYSKWLVEEQTRLYDELEDHLVHRSDIDQVREKIAMLRAEESRKYLAIEEAESARKAQAEEVRKAEVTLMEARRKVQKFDELVEIERTERALEAQYAEDQEMEDFSLLYNTAP